MRRNYKKRAAITPAAMRELIAKARETFVPTEVFLNPVDYPDIRMFGNDVLDLPDNRERIEKGHAGDVEKVSIMLDASHPINCYTCTSADRSASVHRRRTGDIHEGPADGCNHVDCIVGDIMD